MHVRCNDCTDAQTDIVGTSQTVAATGLYPDQLWLRCAFIVRIWSLRTGDVMFAEDLAQDTAMIVLRRVRASTIEDPARLGAFIYRTAHYLHIAHQRKAQRQQTVCVDDVDIYPGSSSVCEEIEALERRQHLLRRISGLRMARDRAILQRVLFYEQTKEEVCESLQFSPEEYDRVLSRARARLVKHCINTEPAASETGSFGAPRGPAAVPRDRGRIVAAQAVPSSA